MLEMALDGKRHLRRLRRLIGWHARVLVDSDPPFGRRLAVARITRAGTLQSISYLSVMWFRDTKPYVRFWMRQLLFQTNVAAQPHAEIRHTDMPGLSSEEVLLGVGGASSPSESCSSVYGASASEELVSVAPNSPSGGKNAAAHLKRHGA